MNHRVVIFGVGNRFMTYKEQLFSIHHVIGLCDNDPQSKSFYGLRVFLPEKLKEYSFEKIIVTPKACEDILEQLEKLQVPKSKIELLEEQPYSSYKALEFVLKNYDFHTVLDVGCGAGIHSKLFMEAGKKVIGIDLGKSIFFRNNICKEIVTVSDIMEYTSEQQFDCIWCSHVLEHVLNVNQFLKKIHSLLREDGVLAITVPPAKDQIVSGHVTIWNGGLILYNLILAGFNCENAHVLRYGYNISVVVKKQTIDVLKDMASDTGDIKRLRPFFPKELVFKETETDYSFDGNISQLNWYGGL